MRIRLVVFLAPLCALLFLLTGCATSFDPVVTSAPPTSKIGPIMGTVYGGRNAIIGQHIYVLAVGTGGDGGNGITASTANASTSLLTNSSAAGYPTTQDANGDWYVTTDNLGNFGLS